MDDGISSECILFVFIEAHLLILPPPVYVVVSIVVGVAVVLVVVVVSIVYWKCKRQGKCYRVYMWSCDYLWGKSGIVTNTVA